jgi:uncharacterized membrane protein (UPF0127 family)
MKIDIRPKVKLRITNQTQGTTLATGADIATTVEEHRMGLLGRESLPPGQGLWIAPCESIHTLGMRFPIDAIFLDRNYKVLKINENVPDGQTVSCPQAHSVLELPAGMATATATQQGDELVLEPWEPEAE